MDEKQAKKDKAPPEPPKVLSRDDFQKLRTNKIRYTYISAGELGNVRIRSLNDKEWAKIQSQAVKANGQIDRIELQASNAKLMIACCVDEDGDPLFNVNDLNWLRELDAAVMERLIPAIRDHIGIIDETQAKN